MLALCPHCGIDLEKRADVAVGDLSASFYGDTSWKGKKVHLTRSENEIVQALARAPNRFILLDALNNIIGSDANATAVRVHVCRIRAKFAEVDPQFNRIESRAGRTHSGYRWAA